MATPGRNSAGRLLGLLLALLGAGGTGVGVGTVANRPDPKPPAPVVVTLPVRPAPTPVPTADVAAELLAAVNAARSGNGRRPLAIDPRLNAAAQAHSDDMAAHNRLAHAGTDGSTPYQRIARAGIPFTGAEGECVAVGLPDPAGTVAEWMGDPPHRAILLGPCTRIGFGLARSTNRLPYWTADLSQ